MKYDLQEVKRLTGFSVKRRDELMNRYALPLPLRLAKCCALMER